MREVTKFYFCKGHKGDVYPTVGHYSLRVNSINTFVYSNPITIYNLRSISEFQMLFNQYFA